MELCDFNLEIYISRNWTVRPWQRLAQIFTIMRDIANGVTYIHLLKEVHRDLKPRNGMHIFQLCLTLLVLYSRQSNNWKIGDFGLTSEGSTAELRPTCRSRGTASYRAPELLSDSKEDNSFTNKVDIWAMGCVFHEVVFRKQAFSSDYAVRQYSKSFEDFVLTFDSADLQTLLGDSDTREFISNSIVTMLQIEAAKRPPARQILSEINGVLTLAVQFNWMKSPLF